MGQSILASSKNHLVKRGGHTEPYDERKLYASIYAACRALREAPATSEIIADKVCKDIGQWLDKKHEVTSHDIRTHAAIHFKMYHEDAAYLYLKHRDIH